MGQTNFLSAPQHQGQQQQSSKATRRLPDNTIKWELIALLNKWLRQFGLALTTAQHLRDLEHQACELTALSVHKGEQKESEV